MPLTLDFNAPSSTAGKGHVRKPARQEQQKRRKAPAKERRSQRQLASPTKSMVLLIGEAPCWHEAPRSLPYLSRSLRRSAPKSPTSAKLAATWPQGNVRSVEAITLPALRDQQKFRPIQPTHRRRDDRKRLDKVPVCISPELHSALEGGRETKSTNKLWGEQKLPLSADGSIGLRPSSPLYALRAPFDTGSPVDCRDFLRRKGAGSPIGRSSGKKPFHTVNEEIGCGGVHMCRNPQAAATRPLPKLMALKKWDDLTFK